MKRYIKADIVDITDESATNNRALAKDPNTRPRTLDQLARDARNSVRISVAGNKNTSPETLAYLANDHEPKVRYAVASNPNTPTTALAKLLDKSNMNDVVKFDAHMICTIIANPKTPIDLLAKIANSTNDSARGCLVDRWATAHAKIPDVILDQLAEDPDDYIRSNVYLRLEESGKLSSRQLTKWASDPSNMVRRVVAQNPELPKSVLTELSKDADTDVRASVAANPSTPGSVLAVLSDEDSSWICRCVATNKNTPIETLQKLAADTRFHPAENVASLARQMLYERSTRP